ncbi:sulfotransferase family cytosolic 1B member 1 [Caerostris darwini]|uniref:Sulfotransferase family cytosolic 1B member 1 n=1 Tax=Caerostris darwini TaxID=1538125 RepID=A0AAV4W037_9ARAC|nr:sulfotransferase family cytosolic 1B member 1 [Caerostris darwini]
MQTEATKNIQIVQGFPMARFHVPELVKGAMRYKPSKDDIIVATYPKCGSTWTMQIVSLILRRGQPLLTSEEYQSHVRYLEDTTMEEISNMKRPRVIKTHLPFDRVNFSKDTKYIYVARQPADCVVSHVHFVRMFPIFLPPGESVDGFLELFLRGDIPYGDYFDNLLSWYKHKDESNILFLTYEYMKADPRGACLKIAKFIEESYYKNLIANNESILKKVMEYSSVDFMKATVDRFWKSLSIETPPAVKIKTRNPARERRVQLMTEALNNGKEFRGDFIRKGTVGEGEKTLSKKQMKMLNDRISEKTADSDVMNLWNDLKN